MVPGYSNGLQQGNRMPDDGTTQEGRCVVCNRRFSNRYYFGSRGPYCAEHAPVPNGERADG